MCDDDIPPDDVSYTSAISACAKGGCWHVAMQLLSEMSEARFNSDLFAYNAVIRACKAGGLWPLALGFLARLRVGSVGVCLLDAMPPAALAPDVISFSSASGPEFRLSAGIRALDRGGAWAKVELVGVVVVVVVVTVYFASLLRVTNLQWYSELLQNPLPHPCWKALDLFWSMPRRKVPPNLFSYSSVVNACGTSLEWQTALCVAPAMALLRGMAAAELTPGAVEVGTAAFAVRSACGRDAAIHFLRDMATLWRHRCRGERSLEVRLDRSHPGEILKTGEGLLAASKPDGISTESFVADLALRLTGHCDGLFPASRLDFPTSGVLPVALGNVESLSTRWLQAQLAGRLVQKEYLCLCEGSSLGPADTVGAVDVPLLTLEVDGLTSRSEVNLDLGRDARTEYKVLGRFQAPHPDDQADDRELMLLSAHPITGRTHQIRVHMAHLGRPLIGDRTYGRRMDSLLQCPRLFLHCSRIRYLDLKEAEFSAHAPLPAVLADALTPLRCVDGAAPEFG
ncbi:rluC [Symbiodinium sp. KB8]|nr:rluC [Symbiodinium sp. KB8]